MHGIYTLPGIMRTPFLLLLNLEGKQRKRKNMYQTRICNVRCDVKSHGAFERSHTLWRE
jgi:hypothetical protein